MLHRPIESTSNRAFTPVESEPITLKSSDTNEVNILTALGPLPGVSREPTPLTLVCEGGVEAGQSVRIVEPASVIQSSPSPR